MEYPAWVSRCKCRRILHAPVTNDDSEAHAYRLDGDCSQHAMPAGEPAPHSDVRAILRAYRSESPFRPPTNFFQAAQPPSFPFLLTNSRPVPERIGPDRTGKLQFTKRRNRTLFTSPSIRNIDNMLDPPALISGKGMPVTGMRPTTIPTFTRT